MNTVGGVMAFIEVIAKKVWRLYAYALKSSLGNQKQNKHHKMLDGSEQSMMPILLDNKGSIIRHDKTVLARQEFSAGTGTADVVMFSIDDKILSKRLKRQKAALTDYRLLSAYLAIERQPGITLGELVAMLNFSLKSLESDILPELKNAKLVELEDNGFKLVDDIVEQTPVLKCVAIEAKVKDWRGGLKQACRYKEFADESYLAIYKKHSTAAIQHKDLFEALGIGLLIVDDGHVEMVVESKNNLFKKINRLLASERLISTLDTFNQPFVVREPFARNL